MGRIDEVLAGPAPPSYHEARARHVAARGAAGRFTADVWLRILGEAIYAEEGGQPMGWHHLHAEVRFVCKSFYLASMHLLRSQFLEQYAARVRWPFTSDPFPTDDFNVSARSGRDDQLPAYSVHAARATTGFARRETRVLDLFIAAAVRTEWEKNESELFMAAEGYAGISRSHADDYGDEGDGDSTTDLFALYQPRARLEDLVLARAVSMGLVGEGKAPRLAVDFRLRSASLRLPGPSHAMRTICEVPRQRDEPLEETADKLVQRWRTTR